MRRRMGRKMVKHARSRLTVEVLTINCPADAARVVVIISLFANTRMSKTSRRKRMRMRKKMKSKSMTTAICQAMMTATMAVVCTRRPGSEWNHILFILFTLVSCLSIDRIGIQIIFVLEWMDYLQTTKLS